MDDNQIVALYHQRDERAIAETQRKYGAYCFAIADRILQSREDAEECVNDTYSGAWNAMPPHKPAVLSTFLGKITRRCALKRWRDLHTEKRGGGEPAAVLEELAECIPAADSVEAEYDAQEMTVLLNAFLETISAAERRVFLRRYWYLDSVAAIADRFGFSVSKVKMMLKRTRDKLRKKLEQEGFL